MKRIALIASLFLAACATNADDNTAEGKADFTESNPTTVITTTRDITIDLDADTQNSECLVVQGWWIAFDFQGHHYETYAADDMWACQARRAGLLTGIHTGQLVEEQHGVASYKRTISLDSNQWVFTSYDHQ